MTMQEKIATGLNDVGQDHVAAELDALAELAILIK